MIGSRCERRPGPRRGHHRAVVVILLLVLILPSRGALVGSAPAPGTPVANDGDYADILPGLRGPVEAATASDVSRYTMDVVLDADAGTIGGTETIDVINRYGEPLADLYLRLFPNAPYYGEGGTAVRDVTVDGTPATANLSADDTVLRIPLGQPLASGATVRLGLEFETTVPVDSSGSYGSLSRVSSTGEWALADWYPILAGHEPGGWRLDPPLDGVDPTFGDVALYDVTMTAPDDMQVISTGDVSDEETRDGETRRQIIAGPVRDLTLVVGAGWSSRARTVGGTTITYWTTIKDEQTIDQVLTTVAESLSVYGDHFGPYPYRDLDLVDVPLTAGTLGISWSGIVFLDGNALAERHGDHAFYQFLLAHEIAHQWWANLVGVNSNDAPFIAEGLTNYVMTMEVEWVDGRPAAVEMLRDYIAARYLHDLATGGDGVADVSYASAPPDLADLVYGKAALGFLAIRLQIGDDAFVRALHDLAQPGTGAAFRIITPDQLRDAFSAAGGQSVDATWETWFNRATTTPADVDALVDQYAAGAA